MIFEDYDLAGAVFFFSENRELIRELNYCEFEALLEGYVPAVDLSNRELNAVYVEINSHYQVVNTVFFLVRFTSRGFIEKGWSVPILSLAQHKRCGPDLGAGAVGLACASCCPDKQISSFLWDPDFKKLTEFRRLAEAVQLNHIGIQFKGSSPYSAKRGGAGNYDPYETKVAAEQDRALYDRLSLQVRHEQEKNISLRKEYEEALAEVRAQYETRFDKHQEALDSQKFRLAQADDLNRQLQETVDGQAKKIQGLREYYELKLSQATASRANDASESALEQDALVESATREMSEMLKMREVEILYRNEQEVKLHEEITKLAEENQRLKDNSADVMLSSMLEKGITFVTYQPGAGHITLPVSEIPEFMQNSRAYVSEKCGVSQAHYSAWLEHYHVPVCRAEASDGHICGENISRVESPADFVLGESDCCHKHRAFKKPRLKLASQ